jgi:ATP-binding cassette subfamily B protein
MFSRRPQAILSDGGKLQKGVFKKLIRVTLVKEAGLTVSSIVLNLIEALCTISVPYMVGAIIDEISLNGVSTQMFTLTAFMAATVAMAAATAYFSTYINYVFCQRIMLNLRTGLIEKLQRLPLKTIDGYSGGDFISRVNNDVEAVGDGILQGLNQLFSGVITIGAIIGFMVYINWAVALLIVALTPLSIMVAAFITKRTQKFFRRQQADLGAVSGVAEELVTAEKTVAAYNYGKTAETRFSVLAEKFRETSMYAGFYSAISNPATRLVNNIVYVAAGALGIYLKLSVGEISSFLMYANRFARPFNDITNVISQLQGALAAAGRVFEVLDASEETPDGALSLDASTVKGGVAFDGVDFSYDKSRPLIQDFNLKVAPGKKVAIVGKTGSGKTTLVNLLMRFYDVDDGAITVEGTDVRDVTRRSLRECFGMVLQDTWLFGGTVKENIAYSKPDASDEEIVEAAKAAHCHDFIMHTENGYDTVLEMSGKNLSEGQKQLICLARVMLKNAPMLILDEATSNIDTRTEILIQEAFDRLSADKTGFIIAHRLSTVRNADIILVLENGNIAEQGNHDELIAKRGIYYDLYNSQFMGVDSPLI